MDSGACRFSPSSEIMLEPGKRRICSAAMLGSPDPQVIVKLSRFPAEVREAYNRFAATGEAQAVDVIIIAALKDFMPKEREVEITDDKRMIDDLGFDSLAVAELVFFLEDCFHVRVETKELVALRTVGEMRAFVAAKITNKGSVGEQSSV
jgi:acyl carrier protein